MNDDNDRTDDQMHTKVVNLEITPTHRELAARLAQAEADNDPIALYDALAEVAHAGIRAAVAVLLLLHGPDPERQP